MPQDEDRKDSQPLFKATKNSFFLLRVSDIRPEAKQAMRSIHQFEQVIEQAKQLLRTAKLSPEIQKRLENTIIIKTEELCLARIRFNEKKDQLMQCNAYYNYR